MEQREAAISEQFQAEFLELYLAREARLRTFVRAIIADQEIAQDVLQEALLTMLKKFSERERQGEFVEWAFRIISYKALDVMKQRKRSRLCFSNDVVQALAIDARASDRSWSARSAALARCLSGLSSDDRGLLASRYEDGEGIEAIAAKTGRSTHMVMTARKTGRKFPVTDMP